MRLISVVMGSSDEESRATSSQSLLNYGFRFFETYALYDTDDEVATTQVWQGSADEVSLRVDAPVFVTVPRGRFDDIDNMLSLDGDVIAPVAKDQPLGELKVMLDDEELASRVVLARDAVEQAGFFGRTQDRLKMWWRGLSGDG
jgi:D-alanyl-D-alanine carboxypeptidase (penicillin-binding protein 5/6)